MQTNSKSSVKSLYFIEKSSQTPISSRRKDFSPRPTNLNSASSSKSPTNKHFSLLNINGDSSLKLQEHLKKKLKSQYMHVPAYLPIIIRDKSVQDSKKTMFFFNKEKDSFQNPKRIIALPYISKGDGMKEIKNAKDFNEMSYVSQTKRRVKENTSKMLIKELWQKSYQKKVLDLSGIKLRNDRINNQRIKPYSERFQDLGNYFVASRDYFNIINENEKNFTEMVSMSREGEENSRIQEFSMSKNTAGSRFLKGEFDELLGRCKEFNESMRKEKKFNFLRFFASFFFAIFRNFLSVFS